MRMLLLIALMTLDLGAQPTNLHLKFIEAFNNKDFAQTAAMLYLPNEMPAGDVAYEREKLAITMENFYADFGEVSAPKRVGEDAERASIEVWGSAPEFWQKQKFLDADVFAVSYAGMGSGYLVFVYFEVKGKRVFKGVEFGVDKSNEAKIPVLQELTVRLINTLGEREMRRNAEPGSVRLSLILVKTRAEAENIISKLRAGENFATLCKNYSIGPARENGGDIGYVTEADVMADIQDTFRLPVGATSDIIETQNGFIIVRKTEEK
jgi:hypothetical protein